MSPQRELRRDFLFDYAVNNPDGFVIDELMAYGWSHHQTNQAIRDLRLFFAGTGDTVNLPCDPQGRGARWLYRLVGDLQSVQGWTTNRVRDAEARVRTMQAMMQSIVAATDGRSTAGRKARVMERAFLRLIEDLDTIMADGAG